MVKAYLRYEHAAAFGVVASGGGIAHCDVGEGLHRGLMAAAALENVVLWSVKSGAVVRTWPRCTAWSPPAHLPPRPAPGGEPFGTRQTAPGFSCPRSRSHASCRGSIPSDKGVALPCTNGEASSILTTPLCSPVELSGKPPGCTCFL